MKTKELRLKLTDELKALLQETENKLQEARFKIAQKQLKNVKTIKSLKKDIAQIKTILKEKI
ncbi:MAG TPA: 50S ribosomal protein L29 [bacterium]|nr:50S ribosomal protein L29 [bacterium]